MPSLSLKKHFRTYADYSHSKKREMSIDRIVDCLLAGGVVLLPTDTVYGLAACPGNEAAVKKIFDLKSRPATFNLPVMVASVNDLKDFGVDLHPAAIRLFSSAFVPGDLTIVLGFKPEPLLSWLSGRHECAIRIPNDERLLEILRKTGPLLVTSANRHGTPTTPNNVADILSELNGTPDLVVDGGIVENIPSTIVNCHVDPPAIERTGRISYETLFKLLHDE
jgi:L-threonylcarbamoyladenylate synthase